MSDFVKKWWSILGPGILYAGAAIGVSHLVQSTRAGAMFGWDLILAIIIANIIKYPFIRLGSVFTFKTGECLLYGYKQIGTWALVLFIALTVCSMFIIQAAITLVTSGLFYQIFGFSGDITWACMIVLLVTCVLLAAGRLTLLNSIIKIVIIFLSVSTIFAAFTSQSIAASSGPSFSLSDPKHFIFLIALMGWMPAPLDISVWQSQWYKDLKDQPEEIKQARIFDFNIGYIGTAILAVFFLWLGRNLMYGKGLEFSAGAVGFSAQIIGLYETAIGSGFGLIIALCVLTTMFSTTLTCMDAFPRVLSEGVLLINKDFNHKSRMIYLSFLSVLAVGSGIIIINFQKNLKGLVDFATILSFCAAPIICWLNFHSYQKVVGLNEMKGSFKLFSLVSFLAICIFCGFYIRTFF